MAHGYGRIFRFTEEDVERLLNLFDYDYVQPSRESRVSHYHVNMRYLSVYV